MRKLSTRWRGRMECVGGWGDGHPTRTAQTSATQKRPQPSVLSPLYQNDRITPPTAYRGAHECLFVLTFSRLRLVRAGRGRVCVEAHHMKLLRLLKFDTPKRRRCAKWVSRACACESKLRSSHPPALAPRGKPNPRPILFFFPELWPTRRSGPRGRRASQATPPCSDKGTLGGGKLSPPSLPRIPASTDAVPSGIR